MFSKPIRSSDAEYTILTNSDNSVMIGQLVGLRTKFSFAKSLLSNLLSIKSLKVLLLKREIAGNRGKWKLSTRLIQFLYYRVEDSY